MVRLTTLTYLRQYHFPLESNSFLEVWLEVQWVKHNVWNCKGGDGSVDIEPNDETKEAYKEETYGYAYAWWFGSGAHVARWQDGNAGGEQSESVLKTAYSLLRASPWWEESSQLY